MMRLIWKILCRLFSRRRPNGPNTHELTCVHANRYEELFVFVYHFRDGDIDRFVPHVTDHFLTDTTPGPSVFAASGCYDSRRAAYLAAKMQIDERCGFGTPKPLEH